MTWEQIAGTALIFKLIAMIHIIVIVVGSTARLRPHNGRYKFDLVVLVYLFWTALRDWSAISILFDARAQLSVWNSTILVGQAAAGVALWWVWWRQSHQQKYDDERVDE